MENQEVKPFQFGVLRILDCGFFIEEAISDDLTIDIGYGMNFIYDIENNWVQFNVKAELKQVTAGVIFISGTVLTRFFIPDLKSYQKESGLIEFPERSLEALFGMAFTHMRAILAKNTAGSRYATMIIPIVNSATLFTDLFKSNVEVTKDQLNSLKLDFSDRTDLQLFENGLINKLKPL